MSVPDQVLVNKFALIQLEVLNVPVELDLSKMDCLVMVSRI